MAAPFTVTITAVDKATATVRKINAQMAKLTSPVRDMRRSVQDFSRASGFDKVGSAFGKVATSAQSAVKSVTSLIPAMGAITSVATVAGVVALANSWGKLGQEIALTSQALGVGTSDLQAYRNAARLAGASAADMDSSLKALGDTIEDATYGRNNEAAQFMHRFNMTLTRTKTGAVDSMHALRQLAEIIAAQKGNTAVQRKILQQFGVSEALLPMLQKGAKGIEEFVNAGGKAGNVMGDEQIKNAQEYAQNITKLDMALEGLKNTIGNALIPVLEPLIKGLSDWVTQNRELIATQVTEFVKQIATWIKSVDWPAVARDVGKFVSAIGGLKGIMIGLAAITFAGPISAVVSLIASLTTLATTAAPAAARALAGVAGAAGMGGIAGFAATAGVAGVAAVGGLAVAKAAGLPDTDRDKGVDAVRRGEWFSASTLLPAKDFAKAMWMRARGSSNEQIAQSLTAPAPAGAPAAAAPADQPAGATPPAMPPLLAPPGADQPAGATPPANPALPAAANDAGYVAPTGFGGANGGANAGPGGLFSALEQQYGLPGGLLDAVWSTESSRGKNMVSPAGAQGHFQFMPATAKQYGVTNPYDLTQSATGAAKMYADLLKQSGGNLPQALAAYNWGSGNVQRQGMGAMPAETRGYIQKVTAQMGGAGMGAGAMGGGRVMPIPTTMPPAMQPMYASNRRAANDGGGGGKVLVEVVISGAPAGTTAKARSSGNVEATTRVREPMLTGTWV
jgi:soluble lytic murein transglycosylase-like protein